MQFGRAYADGTYVSGYFGYDDVTIAGLTAQHQRIAIVNSTYWYGDGKTSGLLGLAYPYMTSLDGPYENQPLYDPIFTTLWKNKLISPMFSVALSRAIEQKPNGKADDRGSETSYLAFGGLPPVKYDESSWARTPIQNMSAVTAWGLETQEHGLYVITAEAYVWGPPGASGVGGGGVSVDVETLSTNTTQFPVLVDVGSTLSILPRSKFLFLFHFLFLFYFLFFIFYFLFFIFYFLFFIFYFLFFIFHFSFLYHQQSK